MTQVTIDPAAILTAVVGVATLLQARRNHRATERLHDCFEEHADKVAERLGVPPPVRRRR